jgi:hypothetical protein
LRWEKGASRRRRGPCAARLTRARKCSMSTGRSPLALAQAGQPKHRDREAIEQVLAEPARRDLLGQAAVGRGDHAHVDLHRLDPPDPRDLALLQHAQELDLGVERQLAQLVEEHRALLRGLEHAEALLGRTGERAALVAEQRRLHQLPRDGAAVHRDELALALAGVVDGPGHELLARARLTFDQDRHGPRAARAACSSTRIISRLRWMMSENAASSGGAPAVRPARRAPTIGTSSAEMSNGMSTGDDAVLLGGLDHPPGIKVLAIRIQTACIAGVPGLRWNVTSASRRPASTRLQVARRPRRCAVVGRPGEGDPVHHDLRGGLARQPGLEHRPFPSPPWSHSRWTRRRPRWSLPRPRARRRGRRRRQR